MEKVRGTVVKFPFYIRRSYPWGRQWINEPLVNPPTLVQA